MAHSTAQNGNSTEELLENGWIQTFFDEGKIVAGVFEPREEQTDNVPGGSFNNRTAPKHKTSHLRFLTWVAYIRKKSPNIDEIERRSCPLDGCEAPSFETPDAMLQHVYTCPRLAKPGLYRCCDCNKVERISRCHTNGCPELHRFPTVARLAKRLLSSHGSKNRQNIENTIKRQATSQKSAELPSSEVPPYLRHSELSVDSTRFATELDTPWRENPHEFIPEIQSFERTAELAVYDPYVSYGGLQDACSELSAGHDSPYISDYQSSNGYVPTDLCAGPGSTWMIADHSYQQDSHQWGKMQSLTENASEHAHVDYSSTTQRSDLQNLPNHQLGSADYSYTYYGDTSFAELQSPLVSPASEFGYPNSLTISNSGSRTNTDVSAISTGSMPSSRDTWVSSFDSIDSRAEHCKKAPARFFKEEADLMFSEPESVEESIWPVELPTSKPSHYSKSTLAHLNQDRFPCKESFVNPTQSCSPVESFVHERSEYSQKREQSGDDIKVCLSRVRDNKARPDSEGLSQLSSIPASPSPPPPPISKDSPPKYKCPCGFEPDGKEPYKRSNLKRHQRTRNCHRLFPYNRPESIKSFHCPYPGCDKKFTRSDNLRFHQRTKDHFLKLDLLQGSSFPEQPGADALRDMLEWHRYQGVETHEDDGSVRI